MSPRELQFKLYSDCPNRDYNREHHVIFVPSFSHATFPTRDSDQRAIGRRAKADFQQVNMHASKLVLATPRVVFSEIPR